MAQTLMQQFNSATSIEDKADVLANYIIAYRKKTRPGSLRISECVFDTGLSDKDKALLLGKVRAKVVSHLAFDYPEIDNTNFSVVPEDLGELARKFDRRYLSTKKWQSKPTLFNRNIFPELNLLKKYPIPFTQNLGGIGDVKNDDKIQISEINNDTIISNSTKFYYNPDERLLFSTVTSLSFDRVDGSVYCGTDLSKIPVQDLLDETKFTRQLDICTYLIPKGNPERAINILRYDGTGFNHYNQVFRSAKHKTVIGEIAKVPHFHFQNHIENLIYLKKEKSDSADKEYSNAGCNAIDCEHLKNYLNYLDGLTAEQLKQESSYGMPFLEAKKDGLVLNIDIKNILNSYALSMDPKKMSAQTVVYMNKLYKELSNIIGDSPMMAEQDVDSEGPNIGAGAGSGGKFRLSNYKSFRELSTRKGEVAKSFSTLVVALDLLEKIHAQQEEAKSPEFKMDLMALEALCANGVIEAMNCSQPIRKNTQGPDINSNERSEKKKDPMGV